MARRQLKRLAARFVATATVPGYYPDGGNLYLQVSDTGSRSWIFRYELAGRAREMGLGSAGDFSLANARERAQAQRKLLADGIDPIEHRDEQRVRKVAESNTAPTFAECAERYISAHRAAWRNPKHAGQWEATIATYAEPVIGKLPVQQVDTEHALEILEPIWTTKHETARRLRARCEHILDWARVHKYRHGDNPFRLRGHLDKLLARISKKRRVKHHPALPYAEIGAFIEKLQAEPGVAPRALEFAVLTCGRTGEVIGAKPDEFDLDKAIWTVPAERMKAGKEHRVPLSKRAIEIVKATPAGEYVFPGRDPKAPLSNMAMLEVLRRMGRADLTTHGFRSSFKDWAAECTNYPNIVSEMALAHTVSDEVEAAYRRGDLFEKRRRLMAEWANYCAAPKPAARVLPMKRRRS
jgi:integrase